MSTGLLTFYVTEGATEPFEATLEDASGPMDLTPAQSIELRLFDKTGTEVETAGKVAFILKSAGTVRYSMAAEDLVEALSPYTGRFLVDDGSKIFSFPGPEFPPFRLVARL
jgi:hypothetical protein